MDKRDPLDYFMYALLAMLCTACALILALTGALIVDLIS